jgi:hypothetical protein
MATHSEKAMATLTEMGTVPSVWQLTTIKWVEEEREIMGEVTCPTCDGDRDVCRDADGKVIPPPALVSCGVGADEAAERRRQYHGEAWEQARKQGRHSYGNCPTCRNRKGYCTGRVKGLVREMVMVGYPQFPAGTKFDSRFSGGCHCHLCNKQILKSWRVPVHGVGADGRVHGMWVGEDCAKKFLAVKVKRAADSIMEDGNGARAAEGV